MKHFILYLIFLSTTFSAFAQKTKPVKQVEYFPSFNNWQQKTAAEMGLKKDAIDATIQFAIANEVKNPRNMEINHYRTFGKEPFGEGIGPFAERGAPTGLIIYKGYIISSWGEPYRCDMTHSVTKSFLSAVVGLAVDSGLIKNVFDTIAPYIPSIELYGQAVNRSSELIGQPQLIDLFSTAHNKTITWNDMLRQTSDWEGTLWGKPEWADRPDSSASNWMNRPRRKSGSIWEYNDVRVNVLSLTATSIWRKPLPQIVKKYIMDPIGASNSWRWTGYRNSWIVLDGEPVQSVSGGGHWGGGLFINAYDMGRFGLLSLHKGNWNGKQLISEKWIEQSLTPTPVKTDYGYMNWFLNTDKKMLPSAPATAFMHIGNGANYVYVDPEHDLVMVARWLDTKAIDGLVKKLLEAF